MQENERNLTDSGLSVAERRLMEALLSPENRMKSITDICQIANISRTTYYNAFDNPVFVERYKREAKALVNKAVGPVVNAFLREAKKGSYKHGKVLLEMADLYTAKQVQEIVGQGGGPIQVQAKPAKVEDILRNMDDEQRAALFATLGGILEGKIGGTEGKMQDKEGNPAENDTVPPAG